MYNRNILMICLLIWAARAWTVLILASIGFAIDTPWSTKCSSTFPSAPSGHPIGWTHITANRPCHTIGTPQSWLGIWAVSRVRPVALWLTNSKSNHVGLLVEIDIRCVKKWRTFLKATFLNTFSVTETIVLWCRFHWSFFPEGQFDDISTLL